MTRDSNSRPQGDPRTTDRIEIITIGDELLLGFTVDTNAAYAARRLADIGIVVARRTTVGDDLTGIETAVRAALDRTGAVLTSGGLGPTSDDMSKPAVARVFGRELQLDEEQLRRIEERWRKRFGGPLPATNRAQAFMPVGAEKLQNNHGSAPGVWLQDDAGRWVAMLPGVPREMRGMLDDTLIPRLRATSTGRVVRSRTLRTTGVPESALAELVRAMQPGLELPLAYLPSAEGVDLRLTSRELQSHQADALLEAQARRLTDALGAAIYDDGANSGQSDLAALVLDACRHRGLTLAVAESCTGGLLGARLTAIPGSSDVVLGGVIAYANAVKTDVLGVDLAALERDGAVSESVVLGMAAGARRVTRADVGVAITGIAGPTGGTADKPVGTVWIATDVQGRTASRRLNLIGDRDEIRVRAAQSALALVRASLPG
jgi:nicotinamide-nucleotide amidase